jgi:type II secretory pathway component PulK
MAALWLVVIVGVTGYELSVRSRSRRLAVANTLERVAADAAAEGGIETARAALQNRLAHPLEARTSSLSTAMVDPWSELTFILRDTARMGDERATVLAYDAGTRLQLNKATEGDVRRLLVALRIDAGVADRLAQRILDWRDADMFHRPRGMERDDYHRAGARVLPSNSDFTEVAELRDVDGMTPELYAQVRDLLTVFGTGQVNFNTAPRELLASLPGMGDEAVSIVLRAQASRTALRSLDEVVNRLSPGARALLVEGGGELAQRAAFDTREVVVEATGWVEGSPVRSHARAVYARGGDAFFTTWHQGGR